MMEPPIDSPAPEAEGSHQITALLRAWGEGDRSALGELVPLVDKTLRQIAKSYLERKRTDPVLTTQAVVNEAYLRLIKQNTVSLTGRAHFFALCARIMRGIVVDYVRARIAQKRDQGTPRAAGGSEPGFQEPITDVIAIDQALTALAEIDPRRGKVVELRFFGGLTIEETAEALEVSRETVLRDWRLARMWLLRQLNNAVIPQSRGQG
jgi:RNA polymerase sigma factor (TIGR02999 family)